MINTSTIRRPKTLKDVALQSDTLEAFGTNLRDWQHEIQRGGVHSRATLTQRLEQEPPLLCNRFEGGDIADAYLAAYAEWIADQAGIPRPIWCENSERCANDPWFATPIRGQLLAMTPASFRQRNLFTIPDPVFSPHSRSKRVPQSGVVSDVKARVRPRPISWLASPTSGPHWLRNRLLAASSVAAGLVRSTRFMPMKMGNFSFHIVSAILFVDRMFPHV